MSNLAITKSTTLTPKFTQHKQPPNKMSYLAITKSLTTTP